MNKGVNFDQILRTSANQGVASWIAELDRQRVAQLLSELSMQDGNLEQALQSLRTVRFDVDQLIASNRGGLKGLHGFIAETAEVGIQNARNSVQGLTEAYHWVNNNGPVDFFRDATPIQQKFVCANGHYGFEAIGKHLETYPDFIQSGGKYQIPKDFYKEVERLMSMSQEAASRESTSTYKLWKWIHTWFDEHDISMDQIEPSALDYSDVQVGQIDKTIKNEEQRIKAEDQRQRDTIQAQNTPTWQQAAQVAATTAVLEGGMEFLLNLHRLRKQKPFQEFTASDWGNIGVNTAIGTGKGALRGASIYAMTSLAAVPAPIANGLVTAAFGIVSQAYHLNKGRITADEFIGNSEVLCVDVAVSTVSSLLGQTLIPIPVLGAVIGNVAGMFVYQIAKNYLGVQEQQMIAQFQNDMRALDKDLSVHFRTILERIGHELQRFRSMMEAAFSYDLNIALAGSVDLALELNVAERTVLKTKADIDRYFLD